MAKEKIDEGLKGSVQNLARIVARFEKENIELYNQEERIKKKFQTEKERLNKEIQKLPEYIEVTITQSLLSQFKFELNAVSHAKSAPEKFGLEYSSGKVVESSDYDKFQTDTQQAVETLKERLLTQQKALDENITYQNLKKQLEKISKEMDLHPEIIKINREVIYNRDEISKTLDVLNKLINFHSEESIMIRKEYESTLQQFRDSEKSFSSSSSSSDSSSSLSSSYSSSSSSSSDSTTSEIISSPSSESPISLLLVESSISSGSSGSVTSGEVHIEVLPTGEQASGESDSAI